ncbi:MAG TPA: iron ABC transporter permease [Bacilli bacterium]|nr:iron ABC transporter permease [Bacilli bacterium]
MKRGWLIASVTAVFLLLMPVLGISIGSINIPPSHVVRYLLDQLPFLHDRITPNWTEAEAAILMQIRVPRTVVGFLVGASLSVAGVAYQGVLRNPLADPYTLGVSTGASVGAAAVITLVGQGSAILSYLFVPAAAFVGACLALATVLVLGSTQGTIRTETLILAGVVVNALFGAVLSLILWLSPSNTAAQIIWWMVGSLTLRDWTHAGVVLPIFLVAWACIGWRARDLNVLAMGDEQAASLGVPVLRVKGSLLVLASLAAAGAVSVAGIIGFVGLVVPHVLRLLLGVDHRPLIFLSALVGGGFLVGCDLIARTVLSPVELSIGIVTALLGAPFFGYLLHKKKRRGTF